MLNNQRVKTAGNLCFLTGFYAYVLRNVKDMESVKTPSGGDKKNEVPLLSLFCSLLHESRSLVDIAWRVGLADQSRRRLEIESEIIRISVIDVHICSQIFTCHVFQQLLSRRPKWRWFLGGQSLQSIPKHQRGGLWGAWCTPSIYSTSFTIHSTSIKHPSNIH